MDAAISLKGVTKSFGQTRAVQGLDLSIPRGGIYAFIAFTSLLSALAALIGCFVPAGAHTATHQENPT